jgi:hypothetical protein
MKKIGSFLVFSGALLMFLVLAARGARAQSLVSTQFAGTFTLPFVAQWGPMTLPPGEYKLYYGAQNKAGTYVVEIRGEEKLPHGVVFVWGRDGVKATKNSLVCVLKGNKGYVRALGLPAIGESAYFALPHGVEVEARILRSNLGHNPTIQLAEMRISIQRVPAR